MLWLGLLGRVLRHHRETSLKAATVEPIAFNAEDIFASEKEKKK